MWHCQKCNEAIDDRFSTCWNCGTNADGTADPSFHREPEDSAVPDPGAEETASIPDIQATPDPRRDERLDVVELCSAANSVEAFAIADALEAAGIKASVVGDVLQATAAGGVPLGEASAPRIWVTRQQQQPARELLAQLRTNAAAETGPSPGTDSEGADEAWAEAGEPAEEPAAEPRPRHDVSLLSVLLALAALGSIVAGIHYAVTNGWLLGEYSRSTEANLVRVERWSGGDWKSVPIADLRDGQADDGQTRWMKAHYCYIVDGHRHGFWVGTYRAPAESILVRYDPTHPAECRIKAILAPAWCIAFGVVLGGFLFFLAYQFR